MRSLDIAVTGASGMIGGALCESLSADGHGIRRLVRREPRAGTSEVRWDPAAGEIDTASLAGVDAFVHLAGEGIASERWTPERKERIRKSRTEGTRLVAEALARMPQPPAALISASAVGWYGNRGDERLTEESPPGTGFLADVSREWEAATTPARDAGIRVVNPRIGVVLSTRGGALTKMLPPFRLGLGGPIGSGRQWMSWIALHDIVGVLRWLLESNLAGPVNATAPNPVTNREFASTLGHVLGRPAIAPLPAVAVRMLFGEMGQALLLDGAAILPARLQADGFSFAHPTLESALRHELEMPQDGVVSRPPG